MWFSLHHFPIPQYFLHPFASRHRDQFAHGVETINASFEEFKGKDAFFVREWLSQKGLEKLCEIFESLHKLRALYDQCNNF